ncbi:MAG: response regulator [Methylococcales bacterium]|jgi:two-component system, cell cycle response regulator DivK|nr:response regulator [Methylococcales bacterium]MBT7444382.1 response regulator [Methylococcales bacterium]
MTKILLVEDNEMNRDMLARRLTRKGYEIVFAEDGQQAVDKTTSETPDIILMDMSLPVMDGWEATRIIKSDATVKQIPIIGLSAHAMSGDREKGLEAGCDEYETKPVDFPALLDKINSFLPDAT